MTGPSCPGTTRPCSTAPTPTTTTTERSPAEMSADRMGESINSRKEPIAELSTLVEENASYSESDNET